MTSRYSRPDILARYLEAEWGDFLLEHASFPDGSGAPFPFQGNGPMFYSRVLDLLKEQNLKPARVLDAGSASGRMLREYSRAFVNAQELVGCEKSPELTSFARSILFSDPPLGRWISVLGSATGRLFSAKIAGDITAFADMTHSREKVHLIASGIEELARPSGYFDLVSCLNVADRHPSPVSLIARLRELTCAGGILCLSSPLDWNESYTPRSEWVDSLVDLLPIADWKILKTAEVDYVFRTSERRMVHYKSQLVIAYRSLK